MKLWPGPCTVDGIDETIYGAMGRWSMYAFTEGGKF